jgi:hypothetical protein
MEDTALGSQPDKYGMEQLYRSPNGDTWFLARDPMTGSAFVSNPLEDITNVRRLQLVAIDRILMDGVGHIPALGRSLRLSVCWREQAVMSG